MREHGFHIISKTQCPHTLNQVVSIMKFASLSNGTVMAALLVMGCTDAFSPLVMRGKAVHREALTLNPTTLATIDTTPTSIGRLFMAEGDGEGGDESSAAAEGDNDAPASSTSSSEDSSLAMMKKEIEQLEQDLKAKKSSLMYAQDQVEEYSKSGYARAVAEMENMRRVRLVRVSVRPCAALCMWASG